VRVVHCRAGRGDGGWLRELWGSQWLARTEDLLLGQVDAPTVFELVSQQVRALRRVSFLDGDSMCWVISREGERFDKVHGAFLDGLRSVREVASFLESRSATFKGEAVFEVGRGRPDLIKGGLASAASFGGQPFQVREPTLDSTFALIKRLEQ